MAFALMLLLRQVPCRLGPTLWLTRDTSVAGGTNITNIAVRVAGVACETAVGMDASRRRLVDRSHRLRPSNGRALALGRAGVPAAVQRERHHGAATPKELDRSCSCGCSLRQGRGCCGSGACSEGASHFVVSRCLRLDQRCGMDGRVSQPRNIGSDAPGCGQEPLLDPQPGKAGCGCVILLCLPTAERRCSHVQPCCRFDRRQTLRNRQFRRHHRPIKARTDCASFGRAGRDPRRNRCTGSRSDRPPRRRATQRRRRQSR
mmetsp:Transcript_19183/g.73389  ORF Transcript_19183/g.73389 Transcript_19183/m.73389 type:complete len:260 (-) Transcript_19183:94-873(-)